MTAWACQTRAPLATVAPMSEPDPRHPALPVHRGPDRRRARSAADRRSTRPGAAGQPRPAPGRARLAGAGLASCRAWAARSPSACADVAMHELDLTERRGAGARLRLYRRGAGAPDACRPGVSARGQPEELHRPGRRVRAPADRPRRAPSTTWPRATTARSIVEIAPQTFSVLVRTGTRLNQLRLKRGEPPRRWVARTSAST